MLKGSTYKSLFRQYSKLATALEKDPTSIERADVLRLVGQLEQLGQEMPIPFLAGTLNGFERLLLKLDPIDGENTRTRVEAYEDMARITFRLIGDILSERPRILGPLQRTQIRHAANQFKSDIWQAGMELAQRAQPKDLSVPAACFQIAPELKGWLAPLHKAWDDLMASRWGWLDRAQRKLIP